MSRPNTGSVTVPSPAGSNGTRFIQSRIVCQLDATAPRNGQRDEDGDDRDDQAAEWRRVRHLDRRDVDAAGAGPSPERIPGRAVASAGATPFGCLRGGLVEAVDERPQGPTDPGPVGRGQEPAGDREVAEEHDERQEECPGEQGDLDPEPGPEDLVVTDARVPDRIGPELQPKDQHDDDDADHEDADRHRELAPQARSRATVVGAAYGAAPAWRRCAVSAAPSAASARTDRRDRWFAIGVAIRLGVVVLVVDARISRVVVGPVVDRIPLRVGIRRAATRLVTRLLRPGGVAVPRGTRRTCRAR